MEALLSSGYNNEQLKTVDVDMLSKATDWPGKIEGPSKVVDMNLASLSTAANTVPPIAIVGMSCRFPGGATDTEKFWNLVAEGRSAWSKVPESRFNVDAFYHPNSERTNAVSSALFFFSA